MATQELELGVVPSNLLARWRVPLSWGLGLLALYLARPSPGLYLLGLLLAAVGEGIRLWASGHLEKNRGVTVSGPYAWTRNPLYLGSFFVGLGFATATGRFELVALFAVLFALVYVPVMKREADRLAQAEPLAYGRYASRVPLLVPRPPGDEAGDGRRFSLERVFRNREHLTLGGWLGAALVLGWKLVW